MIVSKEELEELQGVTQKQIRELEKSASPNTSQIFILQTLDSNISLVLGNVEIQNTDTVELGSRDNIIKEALISYRAEISSKQTEQAYVGEISFYAETAMGLLGRIKSALPASEAVFSANVNYKLASVLPVLKELAALQTNPKQVQKWLKNNYTDSEIKLEAKAAKSTAKAAPAPKATAAKTEKATAKTASAKSAKSAKATAKKPAAKTAKSKK